MKNFGKNSNGIFGMGTLKDEKIQDFITQDITLRVHDLIVMQRETWSELTDLNHKLNDIVHIIEIEDFDDLQIKFFKKQSEFRQRRRVLETRLKLIQDLFDGEKLTAHLYRKHYNGGYYKVKSEWAKELIGAYLK